MRKAAELAGMSYETLKFYCKEGLVPNVQRDKNNYRMFSEDNIVWLKSLQCFKQSGMSISELRRFMQLSMEGKETLPTRMALLENQKQLLERQIEEIQENIAYINHKIEIYQGMLDGTIEYVNKLAPRDPPKPSCNPQENQL